MKHSTYIAVVFEQDRWADVLRIESDAPLDPLVLRDIGLEIKALCESDDESDPEMFYAVTGERYGAHIECVTSMRANAWVEN